MASGNMKARWNQQSEQGVCPSTSPMNSTESEATRATSHAENSAFSPRRLSMRIDPRAEVRGDLRGGRAVAVEPHEAAIGIEQEHLARMPDRVAVGRSFLWDALVEDLEGRGGGLDLLWRAGEAQDRRMELRHVFGQLVRPVAFAVDGDKERLHRIRLGAEVVHDLRDLRQCGRTDIGTVREAEEYQAPLAPEILGGSNDAVMVRQLERRRHRGRGVCRHFGRARSVDSQSPRGDHGDGDRRPQYFLKSRHPP